MAPPLAVLAGGFATFGAGALAHGSGFVAVYLYGLVLGDDADLPQADAVRAFGEQLASLAEIAMFVLLGVALAQVPLRGSVVDAAVLTLVLVLVIRPAFVYPALRLFRRSHEESVFATAGGLKGAVPILLAALPLQARGSPGSCRASSRWPGWWCSPRSRRRAPAALRRLAPHVAAAPV